MNSNLPFYSAGEQFIPSTKYFKDDTSIDEKPYKRHLGTINPVVKSLKDNANEIIRKERIIDRISERIAQELLECSSNSLHIISDFVIQQRKLAQSYRSVMEEFSSKMDKWEELRKKNIRHLQNSIQKFALLQKSATGITLASSILEFLHTLLNFSGNPKYSLLVQMVSGLSITCSFSAFMYSSHTIKDIFMNLKAEKYLMWDLETIYRKGNWIDKDVEDLFPHSIDLNLVQKAVFLDDGNLREPWRLHLCSAVIMSSIKEDLRLLHSEKFLASVKAFVRSPVAQVWINRMKLRILLNDMNQRVVKFPGKTDIISNGIFVNLAAVNMYPVFCDVFGDSRTIKYTKLVFYSLSAINTASSIVDSSVDEGFQDLKMIFSELQKDYKRIKRMTESLVSDYD